MGFDDERARGLIRVSLGRFNTEEEVDRFLNVFRKTVGALSLQSHREEKVAELPHYTLSEH